MRSHSHPHPYRCCNHGYCCIPCTRQIMILIGKTKQQGNEGIFSISFHSFIKFVRTMLSAWIQPTAAEDNRRTKGRDEGREHERRHGNNNKDNTIIVPRYHFIIKVADSSII
mmetsp:Transcript_13819/g.15159  ORF Transcript_13819/g.15159 Transcript_13819/m.15159 type:complete len:112 (-) Transcript_13819:21-356(-)